MSARVAPQPPLEAALRAAADDPGQRPAFYRLLLASMVYVIGDGGKGAQARRLGRDERLSIRHWRTEDGGAVVPFFTSLAALQCVLNQESAYLALPARELFALTRGANLVLDPRSDHARDFRAAEIADLLERGADHLGAPDARAAPAPAASAEADARAITLDQPDAYSPQLLGALRKALARRPAVARAFLCRKHDPVAGAMPSLLIGLEGDGDLAQALAAARDAAAGKAPRGATVEAMQLRAGDQGPSEYLLTAVAPFYTRAPHASGLAATIRGWFRRG